VKRFLLALSSVLVIIGALCAQVVVTRCSFGTVATPNFSSGSSSPITISDSNSGLSGYAATYCTDTTNTCTPSTSYTGAVTVSGTGYIRAQACATSYACSAVGSAAYTISAPTQYGYTSIGATNSSQGAGQIDCTEITTGSDSNGYAVNTVSAYVSSSSTMTASIYSGSTGTVTEVCTPSSGVSVLSAGWYSFTPTGCSNLAANSNYQVCVMSGPASYLLWYETTGTFYFLTGADSGGNWPSSTTLTPYSPGTPSIYVTVTPQ
jgi:hypothetical protein